VCLNSVSVDRLDGSAFRLSAHCFLVDEMIDSGVLVVCFFRRRLGTLEYEDPAVPALGYDVPIFRVSDRDVAARIRGGRNQVLSHFGDGRPALYRPSLHAFGVEIVERIGVGIWSAPMVTQPAGPLRPMIPRPEMTGASRVCEDPRRADSFLAHHCSLPRSGKCSCCRNPRPCPFSALAHRRIPCGGSSRRRDGGRGLATAFEIPSLSWRCGCGRFGANHREGVFPGDRFRACAVSSGVSGFGRAAVHFARSRTTARTTPATAA